MSYGYTQQQRQTWKRAARTVGLRRYERNCGLKKEMGRMVKAWRVPGTREAGEHAMLVRRASDLYRAERAEQAK